MLFENPNAKLFPAFNIPPPVRLSGALGVGGMEVVDGGLVGSELTAHVLNAQAAAHAAASAAAHHHQQQQQQQQQIAVHQINAEAMRGPSPGRSTPVSALGVSNAPLSGTTSPSPSKLFVGGLSWQTSSDKLREYFAMFGPVSDVLIMKDPVTQSPAPQFTKRGFFERGHSDILDSHTKLEIVTMSLGLRSKNRREFTVFDRSRGFGFITFQDATSVDKVLAVPVHTLDGKRIDPKHATPKSAPKQAKTKKIFVGGVGQDTSAEEVRAYFSQFGQVEDAVMLMDQQTKRHRGFGFVTFLTEEAVERVCDIHFHTIKNKKVECKRAQPKEAVAAAAPLALGKRLAVLRPGRGLVYTTTGSVGAIPTVGAAHAYRYSPYAVPAGAAAAQAAMCAPPQPQQPTLPQFGAAYSLAGVDMSSFQGVDWGAMYGLPMYI